MTIPRAFISFVWDRDDSQRQFFTTLAGDSTTPFSIEDYSIEVASDQQKWLEEVWTKIGRCHLMIVLVSTGTEYSDDVAAEISMAGSQEVPFFGVYVDYASRRTPLPKGLSSSRVVGWDWGEIGGMIDIMMTEGKNA
jgi:hypothetical protein